MLKGKKTENLDYIKHTVKIQTTVCQRSVKIQSNLDLNH